MNPLLSILIPTIPSRVCTKLPSLIKELERQIDEDGDESVELLCLYDNKWMKTGAKRNAMTFIAHGDYVVFIDDDDWISPLYTKMILDAIRYNPGVDVIHFPIEHTTNGENHKHCEYGLTFDYKNEPPRWWGKPTHTHLWRREIVDSCRFPDSKMEGEDVDWVAQACALAKTEHRINEVLYFYRWVPGLSEARD